MSRNKTTLYHICRTIIFVDVPRVAQRYRTIATHTRRRASVLVVFVVFCVHMHSFAGLIRRTPPPTFSDTVITERHSDTTIFQLRAHWVLFWSVGSEKSKTRQMDWIKQFDQNLLKHFETVQLFIDFHFYFKLSNVVFLGSVKYNCSLTKNKCTLQVGFHYCSYKQTRFLYV